MERQFSVCMILKNSFPYKVTDLKKQVRNFTLQPSETGCNCVIVTGGPGNRMSPRALIRGGVLTFTAVDPADEGEYTCKALNTHGEHTARVSLFIQSMFCVYVRLNGYYILWEHKSVYATLWGLASLLGTKCKSPQRMSLHLGLKTWFKVQDTGKSSGNECKSMQRPPSVTETCLCVCKVRNKITLSTQMTWQLQNRNLLKYNFITNYTVHSFSFHFTDISNILWFHQ